MLWLPLNPSQRLPLTVVITSVLWLLYRRLFRKAPTHPLPPGPAGKFLIGNAGQLGDEHPEQDYIQWGKEYKSDVIYTSVLGQHMVCLNSVRAATDLLDLRGANYCDRPRFTLFEVMGWGLTLTFLPWGPQFKVHRRLFQSRFMQSKIKSFQSIQVHEARKAVCSLVTDPASWKEATLLMTTSIIFRVAYGQGVSDQNSPYFAMAIDANDATTNGGIAGSTLVDIFPPARWLPQWLCPSAPLRHARKSRAAIQRIHNVPWESNMQAIDAGTASTSFMKTHLEKYRAALKSGEPQDLTPADIKGATCAVFIAGGNSTYGTILSCMLFLTKYPALQAQVAAELDELLLSGNRKSPRLPTFDDRPALKRLNNFMQETLRCLPLNPLVIPHKSLREDVYRGQRIPAGTTVFANTTAMSTDPATYAEPHVFDPSRYDRDEPPPSGNFGFGRRRCPGSHLALASVYMFLATLLAVFKLEMVLDAEGRPKEPVPGVRVGLGGHPNEFESQVVLRNPEMARLLLVREEW